MNEETPTEDGKRKGRKKERRKAKRSTHPHAHSTSQQKGTESLTHSAVACWRFGSDSHGRRESGPVSDARLQADHRSSAAVKECGQSTFFPRFVSERGTTSAHPPLHTRSQPPSLSLALSPSISLSLFLWLCVMAVQLPCAVWECVRVCVSECWSREAWYCSGRGGLTGESSYCITLCFLSHPYSARAPAQCCILQRGT